MAVPYLINPRGKRKKKSTKRKTPRRGKNGRFMKSIRTKSGKRVTKAAWRRTGMRRNPKKRRKVSMAKSRRRRLPARSASGRFVRRGGGGRRRRTVRAASRRRRRNPPLFRGIVGQGVNILIGGAGVTAGEIVNRQGVSMLKLDPQSPIGIAGQLAIALAAGIGAKRFLRLSGPFVDGLVYGAASAPFKAGLRLLAPGVAARLIDGGEVALTPGTEGWPVDGSGMGAYATALPPGRDAAALMGAYSTGIYG